MTYLSFLSSTYLYRQKLNFSLVLSISRRQNHHWSALRLLAYHCFDFFKRVHLVPFTHQFIRYIILSCGCD